MTIKYQTGLMEGRLIIDNTRVRYDLSVEETIFEGGRGNARVEEI